MTATMTANDVNRTTPRPSAKFWDMVADRYARKPIADEEAYRNKLRITRDYLRPDMEVLEFGCGTGSTALAHAPFVRRILATDISSRMIEIARGKAAASGVGNVEFQQCAIDDFSAPDESFDAVLGLSILHLLADRDAVLAKVHRLLKPGGVFVSSTTCLGDTMGYFKLIAPIGKALGIFPLVKVFTEADLRDGLTRQGFEIDHRWQPGKGKSVFIVAKKPS